MPNALYLFRAKSEIDLRVERRGWGNGLSSICSHLKSVTGGYMNNYGGKNYEWFWLLGLPDIADAFYQLTSEKFIEALRMDFYANEFGLTEFTVQRRDNDLLAPVVGGLLEGNQTAPTPVEG